MPTAAEALQEAAHEMHELIEEVRKTRVALTRTVTDALAPALSIPNAIETVITWPVPQDDTDNTWSPLQPSRLYIPVGVTKFKATYQVCFEANSSGGRKSRLLINSAIEGNGLPAVRDSSGSALDVTLQNASGAVYDITDAGLVPNGSHYIDLRVVQESGGPLNLRNGLTWINIEWRG